MMMQSEFQRHAIDLNLYKKESYCTMKRTTDLVGIPKGHGGGNKYPKLSELYRFLFDEDFENAHDAMADVTATAKCFQEIMKRNNEVSP